MCNKECLKDMMNLDKPVLTTKFADKIKPYAKIIYIVLVAMLALFALAALVHLVTGKVSVAFIELILIFVSFVIVRMFCEFLTTSKK